MFRHPLLRAAWKRPLEEVKHIPPTDGKKIKEKIELALKHAERDEEKYIEVSRWLAPARKLRTTTEPADRGLASGAWKWSDWSPNWPLAAGDYRSGERAWSEGVQGRERRGDKGCSDRAAERLETLGQLIHHRVW